MENKIEIKEAFNETYIILNELGLYNKLPYKLKKLIENNLDGNYDFSFNKNIPLFNQVRNVKTRNLLTYIYINYINKDDNTSDFFEKEINDILNQ